MSSGQVSRIRIKYRANHPVEHEAGWSFTAFLVSLQGKPYRPPANGQDLQDVHGWLKAHGFVLTQIDRSGGGRGDHYQGRYTEFYELLSPTASRAARPPMTTRTAYNSQLQEWHVLTPSDEIVTTATDADLALWAELRHYDPELHRLAFGLYSRYPALGTRACSAGHLVARGMVTPNGSPHAYHVQSRKTEAKQYTAEIPPSNRRAWACYVPKTRQRENCPDLQFQAPTLRNGARCAHLTAAWLYTRLPDPTECKLTFGEYPDPPDNSDFDQWADDQAELHRERRALAHEETMIANRERQYLGLDPLS